MLESVGELRARVMKAHRAAGKKVSRIKSELGLKLSGGKLDPRRDTHKVKGYTRAQLNSYAAELGKFNHRSNQFVVGSRGVAIPKSEFRSYQSVEKVYNDRIARIREAVSGITLGGKPKPGESRRLTIGERFNLMIPNTGPAMGGGSMRYFPLQRSSRGIVSPEATKTLVSDLLNRMQPGYQSQQEERIRHNFDALVDISGREDIKDLARQLTTDEFALIWNFSPVVKELVENYQTLSMMSDKDNAMEFSGITESFDEIKRILQWTVDSGELRNVLSDIDKPKRKPRKRKK